MCDFGYLRDPSGHCTIVSSADAEPTCEDGVKNGAETGIDCGFAEAVVCGLCGQGQACDSSANCESGLICRQGSATCGRASKPAGTYVTVRDVVVRGVSPKQFLEVLQEAFVESVKNRTGALEVTIDSVTQAP